MVVTVMTEHVKSSDTQDLSVSVYVFFQAKCTIHQIPVVHCACAEIVMH